MAASPINAHVNTNKQHNMKASEISLRNIIMRCADGIIILNRKGIVQFVNPAANELFGRNDNEMLGVRFGFPVIAGETIDIDILRKGGQTAIAEMRVVEIEWEGEICYLATLRDITERKQAEEARAKLIREAQAQAQAEEVKQIKEEFLATLSHELRTPLTAILGWAKILHAKRLDETAIVHASKVIERNAELQARIVDDLLTLAHFVTGKIMLNTELTDLIGVINNAVETIRPSAQAKKIDIKVEIATETGRFIGDLDRLQQALVNLLSNATKFTPEEGLITVQLARTAANYEITVSDNGLGIPDSFLPYVFECFTQADSSITRSYGGLGIGLAITRYIVEYHGGTILAFNLPGGIGAGFKITLPIREVASV